MSSTLRMMQNVWADPHRRDRVLLSIVVAWTSLMFCAFQPGLMSWDSMQQYAQGLSGDYGNWHPPFVSLLSGIAGRLFGSPWPILLAQLLVLAGGMAALARLAPPRKGLPTLVILAAYLLAPPIWSLGVTLWKDVLMAAAMLGAVVALRYGRPWQALACVVLSVLCRHNAIFGAAPLAVYTTVFIPQARGRLLRSLTAAATLAVLVLAPKAAERALHAEDQWTGGALLVFDEVGIYASHPDLLASSPFASELSARDVTLIYMPANCVPIFSGGGPAAGRVANTSLVPRRPAIISEWLKVVRAYPGLYAMNRLRHFQTLLSASAGPVCYPFHVGINRGNRWGFRVRENTLLYRGLRSVQEATRDTLLFRGWFWTLATTITAAVALGRYRKRALAFWTAISGLGYAAAYLVVGVACDFRFLFWTVIAVFAALLLWFADADERASMATTSREAGSR